MRADKSILLAAAFWMVPGIVVGASNAPPVSSFGPCLPVVAESLPLIITGQGLALQQATPVTIVIDIQPNRTPNRIYLSKNYTVYVAVLGSADFSVADLDPATVAFGRMGEEATSVRSPVVRDINGDGLDDALYGFLTFDCGFQPGDTVGWLRGLKADETPVQGSDTVVVSP